MSISMHVKEWPITDRCYLIYLYHEGEVLCGQCGHLSTQAAQTRSQPDIPTVKCANMLDLTSPHNKTLVIVSRFSDTGWTAETSRLTKLQTEK